MVGKRGPKPKGKVKIKWSADFAYAIGLIATDGNLSPDGRHINFTSKDFDQIKNFLKALKLKCWIGKKARGGEEEKKYFVVQFSDVFFYYFLNSIGLYKAKSKTMAKLGIPQQYFFDFVRGCFDGDGCSYSYWDSRWKSSFMFYITFASASKKYVDWYRSRIFRLSGIKGHVTYAKRKSVCFQLKYSKYEAIKLAHLMYKKKGSVRLKRKYLKIKKSLDIVSKHKGRVFVR